MSAWTPEEIAAEHARRAAAEKQRDEEHAAHLRRHKLALANAICVHCGSPFISSGLDASLCETCLGDE